MSSVWYPVSSVRCPKIVLRSGDCVIDLVMVVDESGSIYKDTSQIASERIDNWTLYMLPFIRDLLNGLDIAGNRIRVGMVMFNNQ